MKKPNAKSVLKLLNGYMWITFAGAINAISMYVFVNPAHLIAGGFSGLSSALTYILDPLVASMNYDELMSVVYFVMNVPLLICSLVFLRGDFTFKTIWATVVCTLVLGILPEIAPDFKFHETRLISVIFGGILIGIAMYIASEHNGSNGGTEVIAKIVSKYHPEIDLSQVILYSNIFINLIGSTVVIVAINESVVIALYSLMYIFVGATFMGLLKRGFNHPQKFMIVTTEYEQLIKDITERFKRGCSCLDIENQSPDAPKRKMIMVVVQYRQMAYLKQFIKYRDPNAFTFVKDVYDVFSRPTFNRSYKTK